MKSRKPILVVEDDPALRRLYWQALTFEGFHAITAEDGITALDCLRNTRPAAIVLDLNVPKLSGWQLHQALMSDPELREIPVMVVTGTDPADVASQVSAILVKPVPVSTVVEHLRRLVDVA